MNLHSTFRIRLHGHLASQQRTLQVELPEPQPASVLVKKAAELLERPLDGAQLTVGTKVAKSTTPVRHEDEIALLPAFEGVDEG